MSYDEPKVIRVPPRVASLLIRDLEALKEVREHSRRLIGHMEGAEDLPSMAFLRQCKEELARVERDIEELSAFLAITGHTIHVHSAVVAYGWTCDGMKGMALGHRPPTPENSYQFHERNTKVYQLMVVPDHYVTTLPPPPAA